MDSVNNIFDSVFRTLVEYLPWLVIPIINEAFRTSYSKDEPLKVLKNEHFTHMGEIVTDLFFEVGGKFYHIEMQSSPDGKMIIRIVEYAFAIALESVEKNDDGTYHMKFPASCVIYLRSTRNTPDKLVMHIDFPNGKSVAFGVPTIKVQEYTKDEIFRKNLLMLLPYYLMRYEKELKEIGRIPHERQEEADQRMESFLAEYESICERLRADCDEDGGAYLYSMLAEQIRKIAEYLAPRNEKERVVAMGGTVIKPEAQIILERGQEQGIEIGKEQGIEIGIERGKEQGIEIGVERGKAQMAVKFAEMGMEPEKIAQAAGVSLDTVREWLERKSK